MLEGMANNQVQQYRQPLPEPVRGSRGVMKAMQNLRNQTLVRSAQAQATAMVVHEQMRNVDHLAREAVTGQAFLRQWTHSVAHGDPVLADELDFFVGLARMAKGQVIADYVDDCCRQNGRY